MVASAAQIADGPFASTPHGYQNVVIPCRSSTDADIITLSVPRGIIWWSRSLVEQEVFGFVADAAPTGDIFIVVEGFGAVPAYFGGVVANGVVDAGDYVQVAYDPLLGVDGGFHLLNWSRPGQAAQITLTTIGTSGPATLIGNVLNIPVYAGGGNIHIVTDGLPVTVLADDGVIILNKVAPSNTTITLPEVALRNGLPLTIVDFNGNGGDVTVIPNGSETIMSLPQAVLISGAPGVGTAALLDITPNVALNGWFQN